MRSGWAAGVMATFLLASVFSAGVEAQSDSIRTPRDPKSGLYNLEEMPTPAPTQVRPRRAAAVGAFVMAALFLLLYAHWRRAYILHWVGACILMGFSMLFISGTYASERAARSALGLFGICNILSALLFLFSAENYQRKPVFRRKYAVLLLAMILWFVLAPLALERRTIAISGYLVIAAVLLAAGLSFLKLLRRTKVLGAGLLGLMFVLLSISNVGIGLGLPQLAENGSLVLKVLMFNTLVFTFAILGMYLLVFADMTEQLRQTNRQLETAREELRRLAITDPLTGCHNRHFFEEVIQRELEHHRRHSIPLSIIFVDVNHFKAVNDTLGHEAGDRILRELGEFLQSQVRKADYVFRWGGDEFLLLLSCSAEEARRKAEHLRGAFAIGSSINLPLSLSIGFSEVPPATSDILPFIRAADERMYEDKETAQRRVSG